MDVNSTSMMDGVVEHCASTWLVLTTAGAEVGMMIVEVHVGIGAGAAPPATISYTVRCCPGCEMQPSQTSPFVPHLDEMRSALTYSSFTLSSRSTYGDDIEHFKGLFQTTEPSL